MHNKKCISFVSTDACTCPTQPPDVVVGIDAIPVYERSCCGGVVNGYDIEFNVSLIE